MSNEEMEEIVSKLNQRINKNDPNFVLDNKTKEVFKNLTFFHQILEKFPDKGDLLMTEIVSKLYIRKYNQFEIIWDDNKKYLNGIFIVLQGVVNVYKYNFQSKSNSNEIKLNISIKKVKNKNSIMIPSELNILGYQPKGNNAIIEDLKPLKIDFVAVKGDSIGNSFLKNIYKNSKYKLKYKKLNNQEENEIKENKYFLKLESKTKSTIAFLTEEDYNIIFEKIITKERHERINFLHNIHYMPRDQAFIERFQNYITKKCFKKNTTIFKQNDEFITFYIIISGSARLSINFNREFFCSLDFDVLIGKHINDRFTTSRFFEITGNYKEKENFVVVDLGEGEVLGGIEFYRKINKYIFTAKCITDVILYEINIKLFNNILSYWNFQRFYNKIDNQFTYFKNRIISMNNFRKEKYKKDDYSVNQNKFILTYKRGHPISAEKESYIQKYTNPFKFEKIFKSKEFKVKNKRYIQNFQKIKNRNETQKDNNVGKMAFITNIPKRIKKRRKIKKSKTTINFKSHKRKWTYGIEEINEEKKENENNINKDEPKKLFQSNIMRHSNSALNINLSSKNVNIRKFADRRLKSCKIENNIKRKINYNILDNKLLGNINNFTTKNISKLSKIKIMKNKDESIEANNRNKINNENNILFKNYTAKNIKRRNNSFINENLTDDLNKNNSNNGQIYYSSKKNCLIYKKVISPIYKNKRTFSQPQINHKSLVFPSGIKEINDLKVININELLPSFISNSYIRNELKHKKLYNINAFFLQQNKSKIKNK